MNRFLVFFGGYLLWKGSGFRLGKSNGIREYQDYNFYKKKIENYEKFIKDKNLDNDLYDFIENNINKNNT